MKNLILLSLFILLPYPLNAEDISVWTSDGYKSLDVKRKDKSHFEIYDFDRGTYLDAEVKRHGKEVEVYDYGSGNYKSYDLDKKPGGGFEAYDSETGKYFEIDRNDAEKLMPKHHDCDNGLLPRLPTLPGLPGLHSFDDE